MARRRRGGRNCRVTAQRRERDSNPRTSCPVSGFQGRCIQPLCHPSAAHSGGIPLASTRCAVRSPSCSSPSSRRSPSPRAAGARIPRRPTKAEYKQEYKGRSRSSTASASPSARPSERVRQVEQAAREDASARSPTRPARSPRASTTRRRRTTPTIETQSREARGRRCGRSPTTSTRSRGRQEERPEGRGEARRQARRATTPGRSAKASSTCWRSHQGSRRYHDARSSRSPGGIGPDSVPPHVTLPCSPC